MILTHLVVFSFLAGASEVGAPTYPTGTLALLGVGI